MSDSRTFRVLFLGDCVGRPGRRALQARVQGLRQELSPDVVIANGENSAGGFGIEAATAEEIFGAGVDVITTGNHIWNKKDIGPYLDRHRDTIVRPANFPEGAPGAGYLIHHAPSGDAIAVVNLMGRVFMPDLIDCPFSTVERLLSGPLAAVKMIFIDFHAEATSEKVAFGLHLDGRVSVVVGTHTHVQTADERVLPKGTAYISDVGMCGPRDGVIGVEAAAVIEKFLTGRPARFEVAGGAPQLNGVVVDIDSGTGRATAIRRILEVLPSN